MPNVNKFTNEQRIFMCESYGNISAERVRDLWRERFPDRPPSKNTIITTRRRYFETGNVNPTYEVRYPSRQVLEEVEVQVCAAAELNHFRSSRDISTELGYSKSTINRIWKRYSYKPYKPQTHQALLARNNDFERRMNFCQDMMERINNDPTLLNNIVFSDECKFQISNGPNRQQNRYRSREKPTMTFDVNQQYQASINVWAGMIGTHIIGPFFIEGNINTDRYLQLLQEEVVPAIRRVEEITGVCVILSIKIIQFYFQFVYNLVKFLKSQRHF